MHEQHSYVCYVYFTLLQHLGVCVLRAVYAHSSLTYTSYIYSDSALLLNLCIHMVSSCDIEDKWPQITPDENVLIHKMIFLPCVKLLIFGKCWEH